jgi:VWFA-related protein
VEDLSAVLAVDTSGSMQAFRRMEQARAASEVFLTKLPARAESGLILFDHEVRPPVLPPALDRGPLLRQVRAVEPRGGTAYLDAAFRGVQTLSAAARGRERALVVMTDGVDLNSERTIEQVIAAARAERVRVFTVGIGEAGRFDPVSTALVLDHSGSMKPPADDADTTPKIEALHLAATKFVRSISSAGRVSVIPFSSGVGLPRPFTGDKRALTGYVGKLEPAGETALFDAVYTAVGTLDASGAGGKRAVVAMTDGVDNSSRRRVEEVIERAKEARIPLHLLGFGREGELDRATMERMAKETGGQYYHARNKDALVGIFENLSIQLHDEGIDEATLTQLARQTGGQYYPAKNVADLKLILERVTQSIQKQAYEVTFLSLDQVRDGRQRPVGLQLVRRGSPGSGGEEVVQRETGRYQTGGLVIAELNPFVYLGLLAVLGGLIALPALLRRGHGSPAA